MLNPLGRISRSTSIPLALIAIIAALLTGCKKPPQEAAGYQMIATAIEDQERRTTAMNSVKETLRLLTELHMVSDPCYPDHDVKIRSLACREGGSTTIPLIDVIWRDPKLPLSFSDNEILFRQDGELNSYYNKRALMLAYENREYLQYEREKLWRKPRAEHGEDDGRARKDANDPDTSEGVQVAQLNPFYPQDIAPPEPEERKPISPMIPEKDWLTSPVLHQRAFTLLRALKPVSWIGYKPYLETVNDAQYMISLEGMANGLPCEGRWIRMSFEISAGDLIYYDEFKVEMTYPAMSSSLLSASEARNRAVRFLKKEYGSKTAGKIRLHKVGIAFPDVPHNSYLDYGMRDLDKPAIYYYYDVDITSRNIPVRHLTAKAQTGEVFHTTHIFGNLEPQVTFEAGDYFP